MNDIKFPKTFRINEKILVADVLNSSCADPSWSRMAFTISFSESKFSPPEKEVINFSQRIGKFEVICWTSFVRGGTIKAIVPKNIVKRQIYIMSTQKILGIFFLFSQFTIGLSAIARSVATNTTIRISR